MECFKQSKTKSEWDKNFTKIWNKLQTGQQMKLYQDVFGEEMMKWHYHPKTHIKTVVKDRKPFKKTWQEIHKISANSLSIGDRRKLYDELVTKYNVEKLDRVVGSKLG